VLREEDQRQDELGCWFLEVVRGPLRVEAILSLLSVVPQRALWGVVLNESDVLGLRVELLEGSGYISRFMLVRLPVFGLNATYAQDL
jgi:hypothetical protein